MPTISMTLLFSFLWNFKTFLFFEIIPISGALDGLLGDEINFL